MKRTDPLICIPNEKNMSRAKNAGKLKQYLRNQAKSYTKRPALRKYIIEKYDGKCVRCHSTDNLQLDHIISVYEGGKNEVDNLQLLCRSCNASKPVESRRVEEWMSRM